MSSHLDAMLGATLAKREGKGQLRRLKVAPHNSVDFSSNDYLSLSSLPQLQEEYLSRLRKRIDHASSQRSTLLGSGGSRLLDGNITPAESLEQDVAKFHNAPAGLLFNSGFDANVGLFSSVARADDIIVYDELIHASVHDGMRLSRARTRIPFAHNCAKTGESSVTPEKRKIKSLEDLLSELTRGEQGRLVRSGERKVFIAVEGVYSMDGDVCPLEAIVQLNERYLPSGNGLVVIDEAHSTGLFGERGRGLVCELGLEERVWARVHTFGKAMGCAGAIVLCSPITRQYLVNYARTLIYTTAMPSTSLIGIKTVYDFLAKGSAQPLKQHLLELISLTHDSLKSICAAYPHVLQAPEEAPRSPILPVFTANARDLAQFCQERGSMVRPIVPPTVPRGGERIRICLHANNTVQEVEALVHLIQSWAMSQGEANNRSSVVQKVVKGEEEEEGEGEGEEQKAKPRL